MSKRAIHSHKFVDVEKKRVERVAKRKTVGNTPVAYTGQHPRLVARRVQGEADVQQPERAHIACINSNSTLTSMTIAGVHYAEASPAARRLCLSFPDAATIASFKSECTVMATLSPPTAIHFSWRCWMTKSTSCCELNAPLARPTAAN